MKEKSGASIAEAEHVKEGTCGESGGLPRHCRCQPSFSAVLALFPPLFC